MTLILFEVLHIGMDLCCKLESYLREELYGEVIDAMLVEGVLDTPSEKLSNIFNEEGVLLDEISSQIHAGINMILDRFPALKIVDYFLIGSSVTYQYSDNSDIDVTVVVDKNTDSALFNDVNEWVSGYINHLWNFKGRPYGFKVCELGREYTENTDAAYDIVNKSWIKKPDIDKARDSYNHTQNPLSKEDELFRLIRRTLKTPCLDLYSILKNLDLGSVEQDQLRGVSTVFNLNLVPKLKDVMLRLYRRYNLIRNYKNKAFSIGRKTDRLSQAWEPEAIVYKFLDKAGYISLLAQVKKILLSDLVVTYRDYFKLVDELEPILYSLGND